MELQLELQLFGPFVALVRGEPLPHLRSRKGHWLLALLALRQGRSVSREWLAGTLWPESEPGQAFYNLRQCLTNLRQALGNAALVLQSPTPQMLCLAHEAVEVDVTAFDTAFADGSPAALAAAAFLYRGPLLEGCAEEWAVTERAVREQNYLALLERLAGHAAARGEPAAAARTLRVILTVEPFRETAHCALMQALMDCGDSVAAMQVYRDLRLLLRRELNADPAPATEACFRDLRVREKRTSLFFNPPLERSTSAPVRRLPVPLTALIGREQNLEELMTWLGTERLVTLTGAGGVGKTRLAIALGEALTYPDGVWFVELAALTDPEGLTLSVAKALNLPEKSPHAPLELLTAALAGRTLLLILDNCEHLRDGCALLVSHLVARCPNLRILVTSRQPLGLTGERLYRVPSLALPPNGRVEAEDLVALRRFAGIQLFVERATQWQPEFHLTSRNAASALRVCHRLDGIPLAIELAAAWMRSLSVEEIDARLQAGFALLTGGSRTVLPRHQTLSALIDWSYVLLSTSEQALLRRLTVFAGGWSLDAAEAVCTSPEFDDQEVLRLITGLADKSLVIAETREAAARYRMLETVRQYAQEKLRELGEYPQAVERHYEYFLALTEAAITPANRSKKAQLLDRLEREYANLRVALTRCREEPEGDTKECRLAMALYSYWYLRGPLREGREYLGRVAAYAVRQNRPWQQAQALLRVGALARMQGDTAEARSALEKGLTLARTEGATEIETFTLTLLGSIALTLRDEATAIPLLESALEVARRGGHSEAETECLVWLGDAARWRGDYVAASAFYHAGLTVAQPLSEIWFRANATGMLAEIALLQGETEEADRLARHALLAYLEAGDRTYCIQILDTIAAIAFAQDDAERAARLFASVEGLMRALQAPLPEPEQAQHARRVRMVRDTLGEERFLAACEVGCRLDWEQILEYALERIEGF